MSSSSDNRKRKKRESDPDENLLMGVSSSHSSFWPPVVSRRKIDSNDRAVFEMHNQNLRQTAGILGQNRDKGVDMESLEHAASSALDDMVTAFFDHNFKLPSDDDSNVRIGQFNVGIRAAQTFEGMLRDKGIEIRVNKEGQKEVDPGFLNSEIGVMIFGTRRFDKYQAHGSRIFRNKFFTGVWYGCSSITAPILKSFYAMLMQFLSVSGIGYLSYNVYKAFSLNARIERVLEQTEHLNYLLTNVDPVNHGMAFLTTFSMAISNAFGIIHDSTGIILSAREKLRDLKETIHYLGVDFPKYKQALNSYINYQEHILQVHGDIPMPANVEEAGVAAMETLEEAKLLETARQPFLEIRKNIQEMKHNKSEIDIALKALTWRKVLESWLYNTAFYTGVFSASFLVVGSAVGIYKYNTATSTFEKWKKEYASALAKQTYDEIAEAKVDRAMASAELMGRQSMQAQQQMYDQSNQALQMQDMQLRLSVNQLQLAYNMRDMAKRNFELMQRQQEKFHNESMKLAQDSQALTAQSVDMTKQQIEIAKTSLEVQKNAYDYSVIVNKELIKLAQRADTQGVRNQETSEALLKLQKQMVDQQKQVFEATERQFSQIFNQNKDQFAKQMDVTQESARWGNIAALMNLKIQAKNLLESGFDPNDVLNLVRKIMTDTGNQVTKNQEIFQAIANGIVERSTTQEFLNKLVHFMTEQGDRNAPEILKAFRYKMDNTPLMQDTMGYRLDSGSSAAPMDRDTVIEIHESGQDMLKDVHYMDSSIISQDNITRETPTCTTMIPVAPGRIDIFHNSENYTMFQTGDIGRDFKTKMSGPQLWAINKLETMLKVTHWNNNITIDGLPLNAYQAYWLYRWMGPLCTAWIREVLNRTEYEKLATKLKDEEQTLIKSEIPLSLNVTDPIDFHTIPCKKRFLFLKACLSSDIIHPFAGNYNLELKQIIRPHDVQAFEKLQCISGLGKEEIKGKVILTLSDCIPGVAQFIGVDLLGRFIQPPMKFRVDDLHMGQQLGMRPGEVSWGTDLRTIVQECVKKLNDLTHERKDITGPLEIVSNTCWKMSHNDQQEYKDYLYVDATNTYEKMQPFVIPPEAKYTGKELRSIQRSSDRMMKIRLQHMFGTDKVQEFRKKFKIDEKSRANSEKTKTDEELLSMFHDAVEYFKGPVPENSPDNIIGKNNVRMEIAKEVYTRMMELYYMKRYITSSKDIENYNQQGKGFFKGKCIAKALIRNIAWNTDRISETFNYALDSTGLNFYWPRELTVTAYNTVKTKLADIKNNLQIEQKIPVNINDPICINTCTPQNGWPVVNPGILVVCTEDNSVSSWTIWYGDIWFLDSISRYISQYKVPFYLIDPIPDFRETLIKGLKGVPGVLGVRDKIDNPSVRKKFINYFTDVLYSGYWSTVPVTAPSVIQPSILSFSKPYAHPSNRRSY